MAKDKSFLEGIIDMQTSTQGTEMGIARNMKAFYEGISRDRSTINAFKHKKSLANYMANKKKGSKGGMR